MRKLFLDDMRRPYDNTWILVKTYQGFIEYIQKYGCPEVISFDHDLAFEHYPLAEQNPDPTKIPYDRYEEKCGWHAAKWLVDQGYRPKLVIVHSMNAMGAENICSLFRPLGIKTVRKVYNFTDPVRIVYDVL